MFGGYRFGPFDSFNGPNQAPNEDSVSSFDSLFHSDLNRMFHEMEEMMRQFHFGHFNFVESKETSFLPPWTSYLLLWTLCFLKDPEVDKRAIEHFPPSFKLPSIEEGTNSPSQTEPRGNLRDHFLKSTPNNSEKRQEIVPFEQQPKSKSLVSQN